jgi:DNA polymerase III epsilon subunit-like protein
VTGLDRPWAEAGWVVVDVEGNGQRPPDLIEAACLPIDAGQPRQAQAWLVRPARPITAVVAAIHGIRNADVAGLPPIADVADDIRGALADRSVVGHKQHVDLAVLTRELGDWAALATVDTLRLAKAVWPGLASYSLDALTGHAAIRPAEIASGCRHRAGYDTKLTAALFLALARDAAASRGDLSAAQLITLAGGRPADAPDTRLF